MARASLVLLSPELLLAVTTGAFFAFTSRYRSYSDSDVALHEKLIWVLPLVATVVAFLAVRLTGQKSWLMLVRVNLAFWVALLACGFWLIGGLGAPGSGPKGQDAALILVVSLGLVFAAIGNAVLVMRILRAQNASLAQWYDVHPVWGFLATSATVIPVGIVEAMVGGVVVMVFSFFYTLFSR